MNEAKQVGTIYHFTTLENLLLLTDKHRQQTFGLELMEFVSYNGHLSTTRNFAFGDMIHNWPDPKKYFVRIAFDGDSISNEFKIKPIAGYIDNDNDIFNHKKNYKRVPRTSGEAEEAILSKLKRFNLLKYIKQIDIRIDVFENDVPKIAVIKERLKPYDIPINSVRKFQALHESDILDMIFEGIE